MPYTQTSTFTFAARYRLNINQSNPCVPCTDSCLSLVKALSTPLVTLLNTFNSLLALASSRNCGVSAIAAKLRSFKLQSPVENLNSDSEIQRQKISLCFEAATISASLTLLSHQNTAPRWNPRQDTHQNYAVIQHTTKQWSSGAIEFIVNDYEHQIAAKTFLEITNSNLKIESTDFQAQTACKLQFPMILNKYGCFQNTCQYSVVWIPMDPAPITIIKSNVKLVRDLEHVILIHYNDAL